MKEMMVKIESLLDTIPDEVPAESKFLLEFDHGKLARSNMHNQTYWVVAIEAAIKAGKRTATTGARHMKVHKKHRMNMRRRARPGINEADEIIRLDERACRSINGEQPTGLFRRQNAIKPPFSANLRSSKRYKPGD